MSGFTVSSLTDYVKENADKIVSASITEATTLKHPGITIIPGIKSSEKLMNFVNTAPFQAGGVCSFNASGSSTFADRTLTVTKLKWNDTFCPETLEAKFLQTKLIPGSNYDSMPFEELIVSQVVKNINNQMEKTIWQGDTNLGVIDLKHFDGWLKTIDAASPVYATAQSSVTASNIIAILDDIYALIPAPLLNNPEKPLCVFMGWAEFRMLVTASKALNYYHFDPATAYKTGELIMPGSGLHVVAVHGLDTITGSLAGYSQRMVCTYPANLIFGTDLANEYEEADFWYSKDDQNVKGSIKWKAGTQIYFGSEIVTYKNS